MTPVWLSDKAGSLCELAEYKHIAGKGSARGAPKDVARLSVAIRRNGLQRIGGRLQRVHQRRIAAALKRRLQLCDVRLLLIMSLPTSAQVWTTCLCPVSLLRSHCHPTKSPCHVSEQNAWATSDANHNE